VHLEASDASLSLGAHIASRTHAARAAPFPSSSDLAKAQGWATLETTLESSAYYEAVSATSAKQVSAADQVRRLGYRCLRPLLAAVCHCR
jgi:hypothetical protein